MTDHLSARDPVAVTEQYELVVRGELSDRFAVLFEGMHLERRDGTTVLTGAVVDQARLHGLIKRVQDLGLELVSVNPLPDPKEDC
jgi:hypothetical protein